MAPSDPDKTRQSNNFDFLRFISSLFVIISHSYSLMGKDEEELMLVISNHTYHFSSFGLICFFVISGYLVSQSLFNSSSILNYAWKRFLRIVPGLCGVILFSMLVIGPLFTTSGLAEYFSSPHTYSYFRNVIFILPLQWELPGLFMSNPERSVNGSLWTLTLEGRLYIGIALVYVLQFFRKRIIPAFAFILLVILSPWIYTLIGSAYSLAYIFGLYFVAGSIAALYKKEIRHNKWFFLLALATTILRCFSAVFDPFIFLAFTYIILYIGHLPSVLNHFGRYGDFSYGMFLFGFPIQQSIIHVSNGNISIPLLILVSIILTLPFAVLSWKLIESKALKYKKLLK